jgi:hypothetical protein
MKPEDDCEIGPLLSRCGIFSPKNRISQNKEPVQNLTGFQKPVRFVSPIRFVSPTTLLNKH